MEAAPDLHPVMLRDRLLAKQCPECQLNPLGLTDEMFLIFVLCNQTGSAFHGMVKIPKHFGICPN